MAGEVTLSRAFDAEELARLKRAARLNAAVFDLGDLAIAFGRPKGEIDRALHALIARTPDEAMAVLNRQAPTAPPAHAVRAEPKGMRGFLRDMFGSGRQ